MDRRSFVAGSSSLFIARPSLAGEAYPLRAVTIITPSVAGDTIDTVSRSFAEEAELALKQPILIQSKSGAGGVIATESAANAAPDGYTLLMQTLSISALSEVDRLLGRQPKVTRADFIPIAQFIIDPIVLIVNDRQPYRTLEQLIDDTKKRPNQLLFSSSGLYGPLHLPTALFLRMAGMQMQHLPTTGEGPSLRALLNNNSQFCACALSTCLGQIQARSARALAVLSKVRVKTLPDVPTLKELGYDLEFYYWVGLFAPKSTPMSIVLRLGDVSRKVAQSDGFRLFVRFLGQEVAYLDGPAFRAFCDQDGVRVEDSMRRVDQLDG